MGEEWSWPHSSREKLMDTYANKKQIPPKEALCTTTAMKNTQTTKQGKRFTAILILYTQSDFILFLKPLSQKL